MNKWALSLVKNVARVEQLRMFVGEMEDEYELVCDLSNGAISNDLERTLTLF